MSLSAGSRLGPYEVVAPLGAGGMGEVYRAKDTRLNRTVAVKVLPSDAAGDTDRRERFEREAKAISALDHPHICPLYDVGEHDGTYFLVMPCLDGQTLADRIANGPLSIDQAVKIAIEIASALDAAHRHGIVHRDLKPGNVMLTKSGVKLLDFGLAKLKKTTGPLTYSGMTRLAGDSTHATNPGTGIGTLLGTMPYMAPEQVEGRDVDARSDIFALGAVIYEMLTGERAFKGDSPASVIGAIMKDTPPSIASLQPLTPPALDHVVSTCLAKDPDERWQSAADIARELKWVAGEGTRSVERERPHGARFGFWTGVAATAAVITAMGLVAWPRAKPMATEVVRFPLLPPPGGSFSGTQASVPVIQAAISPDGKQIVFVAARRDTPPSLWVRALDHVSPRMLEGTANAIDPFWSPDSKSVGFFADGRLKRIELASGRVQDICEASYSTRGAAWAPDGTIIFGDASSALVRVASTGGPVTKVLAGEMPTGVANSQRWPQFLPDGRHFLFYTRGGAPDTRGVFVASLDGGVLKRLLDSTMSALYADGHLLVIKDGALMAYPFDPDRLEIAGEPITIASQVGGSSTQQAPMSVSQNGVLVYGGGLRDTGDLQWFDRAGSPLGDPVQSGNFVHMSLSPDETALLTSRVDPLTNTSDIWLVDLTRVASTRITLDPLNDMGATWSPDGSRFVFRSDRGAGNFLYGLSLKGGSREETVYTARDVSFPTDWSADGHILYHTTSARTALDVGAIRLSDQSVIAIAATRFNEYDAHFSPDGKWVAYVSEESGEPQVYVQPFPPTGRKWAVSTNGGAEPRWRGDGRELFFVDRSLRLMSVTVNPKADEFRVLVPQLLFQTRIPKFGMAYRGQLVAAKDGRRFLLNVGPESSVWPSVTVVLNWTAALAQ